MDLGRILRPATVPIFGVMEAFVSLRVENKCYECRILEAA